MATQTTSISEFKVPKQFTLTSPTRTATTSLQGWKEIAAYLKRGVRTVQRWERFDQMPVRRARPSHRSPVFAFPEELDHWLHSRPTRSPVYG